MEFDALLKSLAHQSRHSNARTAWKPTVFDLASPSDVDTLGHLIEDGAIQSVVDDYDAQAWELEIVEDPTLLRRDVAAAMGAVSSTLQDGRWVFYPWRRSLVHCLERTTFERLRLSRNRDLITLAEQGLLEHGRVGIAGLNVGNAAAVCLALETSRLAFKLADHDHLALSNLNRFRAATDELGTNKAVLTARQVFEINPFAEVDVLPDGILLTALEEFVTSPRLDVLIEETDFLPLKVMIREVARKAKVPVVMVTGNGPNLILDVERFDLDPDLPVMGGRLEPAVRARIEELGTAPVSLDEKIALARDFMGVSNLVPRLQDSFAAVGITLAGIPQIAEATFLRGAVLGHVVRRIITGAVFQSGRYHVQLDPLGRGT